MIVVVKSGRACLRVGLAAHLASQSSVTGISASLQALVLPGALSILFLFFVKTAAFDTRGCGSPARATFIVDLSGTLRYMAAHRTDIPRCFNRSFSPPYIAQLLLFKERDRDPSAGAGFPPLRPHWTCESQASNTFEPKKLHVTCHRPCPPTGLLGARKFPQTSPTRWRISSRSTERGRRCQMRRPLWTTTWRTRSRWRRWRSPRTLGRRS